MIISYTAYGEQEKIIRFFKRIKNYINQIDTVKYFLYESEDDDENSIYAISFSITGKSSTKELAIIAEEDIALLYSFKLPNCSFEKTAFKAKGTLNYTQLVDKRSPYENYRRKLITQEEFLDKGHILYELNDFEDMESYEDRIL